MTNDLNSPNEFDKLSLPEKQILIDWCSNLNQIKSINTKYSSYSLKHIFERSKNGFYITNGAFKGAMLKCGFNYKSITDSPNWYFNVSQKSIEDIKKLNEHGY